MKTYIVIDDNLMAEGLKLSEIKTKKNVVDNALKLLVQIDSCPGLNAQPIKRLNRNGDRHLFPANKSWYVPLLDTSVKPQVIHHYIRSPLISYNSSVFAYFQGS